LTPACGIVSSSLFSSGPVRFREAGTRACGAGCGRSRPLLLLLLLLPPPPCRLVRGRGSRQLRIVAMASPPEPPSTTRQARSGLIDGRSRPRDRSVMRARALTGAARSGCGRPGGKSSGHHQTERLAGLDRGRPERVVDRGLLALPSDSVSEGAGPTIRLRRRKVGFPVGASTFRHKIGRQKHGRLSCHGQAGHSLGRSYVGSKVGLASRSR
jgi:hypothetical protein